MKKITLICLFLINLLTADEIRFKIVNLNNEPIPKCQIKIFTKDSIYTIFSDNNGYAKSSIPPKIKYIIIEKELYKKKFIKNIINDTIVKLEPIVFILPEYSVFGKNFQNIYASSIESIEKNRSTENTNFNNLMVNYGFLITDYGGEGGLKLLKIRGHRNNDIKFILDDIILNNPQNGSFDLGLLGNLNIKNINILKEGSGIFNGSGAMGGAVYLNTGMENKITLGYGSFDFFNISFENNFRPLNKLSISYKMNYQKSDGDYKFRYNSKITKKRKNNEHELGQLYFKFQYNNSNKLYSHLTLFFDYFYRGVAGPMRGPTPNSNLLDKNLYLAYSLKKIFTNDLIFKNVINYNILYEKYVNPPYPESIHKNYVFHYKATVQKNCEYINFWSEITYNNERINSTNTKTGNANSFEFSFVPNFDFRYFNFLPGIKYINYKNKNYIVYSISLNKKMKNIKLYSNFSKNYNFPTFNDLYWSPGGNPELNPEFSQNISIGGKLETNKIKLDLSFYNKNYTDLIMWKPVSAMVWSPFNISKAEGYGIEILSTITIKKYITLKSKYNFQKMELANGLSPVYYPKHTFNEVIGFTSRYFDINLFINFYDKVFYSHDNLLELPSYWLFNSIFSFKLNNYLLSMELNNIFNKEYVVVKNYPMPGRNFKFFISKKF